MTNRLTDRQEEIEQSSDILPNFCDNRVLLVLLLMAESLAIILTLSQVGRIANLWIYLGKASMFILSIALVDAAVLCFSNRHMAHMSLKWRALLLYVLLQLITIIVTIIAHQVLIFVSHPWPVALNLSNDLARNLCISLIITGVMLRYFYLRHQNIVRQKAEDLARIQALQARIRPHFLFNSINTIANLIHNQPAAAEEALVDLAELFRNTINKPSEVSLGDELDIVRRYLNMEKLRLGDRLRIDINVPDELNSVAIPTLLIQPLVENAVYHGIEPLANGGTVKIGVEQAGNFIYIIISNPLPENQSPARTGGNQIAVDNIKQRLALAYSGQAALDVESTDKSYTVKLTIPKADDTRTHS